MICRYHNIDCDNANENGYCKTSACVNPKFVVNIYPTDMEHYVGDKSKAFHFEESMWHTGTPTEEGIYVVAMDKYCPRISLYKWADGRWEGLPDPNIVMAWIKVPPYEEVAT